MSDYELDVTKMGGETVTITTPTGKHTYDVLQLTREPMLKFDQARRRVDAEDLDVDESAAKLIDILGSLLAAQNGGPSARDVLDELWQDGYLAMQHLEQLTRHLLEKAGTSPPA